MIRLTGASVNFHVASLAQPSEQHLVKGDFTAVLAVRSRLDQEAMSILEARTERVKVIDTFRYATPLLRAKDAPLLKAAAEAVMPMLCSTERRLEKDPAKAKVYEAEIQKLINGGCVTKLSKEEMDKSNESWFIPHHLVHHNGKDRLVFDCSFTYCGLP